MRFNDQEEQCLSERAIKNSKMISVPQHPLTSFTMALEQVQEKIQHDNDNLF